MTDTANTGAIARTIFDGATVHERLDRIIGVTNDLTTTLKAQQELLKMRDITLDTTGMDGLQDLYYRLAQMTGRIQGDVEETEQLRALSRTIELINSTLALDMVLNDVIDTVISLTGAERGYIVLKDPDSGKLQFRVARNAQQRTLAPNEFTVSRVVIEQVAATGQLISTTDAQGDERINQSDSVAGLQLRSILCVPLARKGVLTGVVYADNRVRPDLFGPGAQRLVQAFANQAALAIENARLFESVRTSLAEITVLKDLMANVFASIVSGVITTDADDRVQTFNLAASRILDMPVEEAVGQPLSSVLPVIDDSLTKAISRVREQHDEPTLELDVPLKTRGLVNLSLNLSPLKGGGAVGGIAIVLNDMTAIKRHTSQLTTLRQYLPPALVDNVHLFDRSRLGGEEREVSVISCDIRGFTSFSENLQPEELMQIINVYLTVSSQAIHVEGGIIDKYMGDAVIGLYNTQLMEAQPNHAHKAVQAAFQMARDVEAKHADMPTHQHLYYGIGVHTGTAVLGNVGSESRKEFTAIGESIQFAKLLQENALGGEVLISQATYDLVKDEVTVEKLTPRKLKDHQDFSVMYRVTSVRKG